jgi:hypothetical protein
MRISGEWNSPLYKHSRTRLRVEERVLSEPYWVFSKYFGEKTRFLNTHKNPVAWVLRASRDVLNIAFCAHPFGLPLQDKSEI